MMVVMGCILTENQLKSVEVQSGEGSVLVRISVRGLVDEVWISARAIEYTACNDVEDDDGGDGGGG